MEHFALREEENRKEKQLQQATPIITDANYSLKQKINFVVHGDCKDAQQQRRTFCCTSLSTR